MNTKITRRSAIGVSLAGVFGIRRALAESGSWRPSKLIIQGLGKGEVDAICERRLERPRVSFSKACGEATRQAAHRVCAVAQQLLVEARFATLCLPPASLDLPASKPLHPY